MVYKKEFSGIIEEIESIESDVPILKKYEFDAIEVKAGTWSGESNPQTFEDWRESKYPEIYTIFLRESMKYKHWNVRIASKKINRQSWKFNVSLNPNSEEYSDLCSCLLKNEWTPYPDEPWCDIAP